MITPLVSVATSAPTGEPKIGGLVTWEDYAGRHIGGRLIDWRCGNAWVRVVGLSVPRPYSLGEVYVIDQSKVIDWD